MIASLNSGTSMWIPKMLADEGIYSSPISDPDTMKRERYVYIYIYIYIHTWILRKC